MLSAESQSILWFVSWWCPVCLLFCRASDSCRCTLPGSRSHWSCQYTASSLTLGLSLSLTFVKNVRNVVICFSVGYADIVRLKDPRDGLRSALDVGYCRCSYMCRVPVRLVRFSSSVSVSFNKVNVVVVRVKTRSRYLIFIT